MSDLSLSYQKVRYDLRPGKQVERLMLIDAFRRLDAAGFPIEDYRYVGMGSVHFYDFILFHRYLGIKDMLSVEASEAIRKRVGFNCPYGFIEVKIDLIGNVLPKLSRDKKHILWLDYDGAACANYLRDLAQALTSLSVGSVVLITLDVEYPKGCKTPRDSMEYYQAELSNLLPAPAKPADFSVSRLSALNVSFVRKTVERALAGREGITFEPVVNFAYRDGHRMLTVGGIIADESDRRRIKGSSLPQTVYYRSALDEKHYEILVPVLTRKERLYLDGAMPCEEGWLPKDFEMDPVELNAYRNIYRFNPMFAELIA